MNKLRRLINFIWNVILSNFKNLNFPIKLNFVVTYKCNQKCLTCNIWKKTIDEEMCLEEIELFFQKNPGFNWIDLTGGEIFSRKDITKIIQTIINNCNNLYLLHFPTNGTYHREVCQAADYLINSPIPLTIVTVSIDGNSEMHNKVRGMDKAFELAVKTFQELKKKTSNNFKVFIGLTLSKYNVQDFDEIFEKMASEIPGLEYNDIHINLAHTSSHFYDNSEDVLMSPLDQSNIIKAITRKTQEQKIGIIKFLESRFQALAVKYSQNNKNPATCQSLSSSVFLDSKGFLYPCITWDKQLGNIKDYKYSLHDFFSAPEKTIERDKIVNGDCPNCWTPCEAYQSIMAQTLPFSRWS